MFGRNGDEEEATRGFQPKEVGKEDAVFFFGLLYLKKRPSHTVWSKDQDYFPLKIFKVLH